MTEEFYNALQKVFERLPDLPTRRDIATITGLIAAQTLSNRDAKNRGIKGKHEVGGIVRYPKEEVIVWLTDYCNKKKK